MIVRRIRIRDIKRVDYLDLDFSAATLLILAGPNGCGKTSVRDGIAAVFDVGHHNPDLIRHGAKKGVVELTIVKDKVPSLLTLTITPSGSNRTITNSEGIAVHIRKEELQQIGTALCVDPLRLAKPDGDAATEQMLKILPVEVTEADIMEASEGLARLAPGGNLLGLRELQEVHDDLYARRRVANVEVKKLDATVETLRRSLPETEEEKDWSAVVAAKRQKYGELNTALNEEITRYRDEASSEILRVTAVDTAEIEELQRRIADLRQRHEKTIAEVRTTCTAREGAAEKAAAPVLERLVVEASTAQQQASAQDRAKGAIAEIEKMEQQAKRAAGVADKLDRALGKIEALKKKALASLPIEGLEFDGEGFCQREGTYLTPWKEINEARRLEISFAVSALAAEKVAGVRFMIVDKGESLDAAGLRMLNEAAKANDFKIALTSVTRDKDDLELLEKIGAELNAPVIAPGDDGTLTVRRVG